MEDEDTSKKLTHRQKQRAARRAKKKAELLEKRKAARQAKKNVPAKEGKTEIADNDSEVVEESDVSNVSSDSENVLGMYNFFILGR